MRWKYQINLNSLSLTTWVGLGAAGVHLDVPLGRDPQDVPLHVDVVLGQVDPDLHVVRAALLRGVGVDVKKVNLKLSTFFHINCSLILVLQNGGDAFQIDRLNIERPNIRLI